MSASAVVANPGYVVVDCGSSTASSQSSSEDLAKIKVRQQRLRRATRTTNGLKNSIGLQCPRLYVGTMVSLMRSRHHSSAASASVWANLLCKIYLVSRQSVGQWELSPGSSVLASMSAFIRSHEDICNLLVLTNQKRSSSIIELIGDATESCCWREHKVECLRVRQTHLVGSPFV